MSEPSSRSGIAAVGVYVFVIFAVRDSIHVQEGVLS